MSTALQMLNIAVTFEQNYMFKNNKSITSIPDIALTEFVANAWDAGAYNVNISIPYNEDDIISIEDDGIGMSNEDFMQRWMTLNYDRQKRQGKEVVFPPDVESYKRIAYGRNGIGRHGMLCFNDNYIVETWQSGICNKYTISITEGSNPFKIINYENFEKVGHGTKISTHVKRHLPIENDIVDIISGRFLYDPKFMVTINNIKVNLLEHRGIYEQKELKLDTGERLHITIIDSTKTASKSQQHGIAFWVCGRLVGKPSWTYENHQFLDGRFKAAKRFTIIVQTDSLINEVLPDWTGFIGSVKMKNVYSKLKQCIDGFLHDVLSDYIKEVQYDVIMNTRDDLEILGTSGQRDVSTFIETVTEKNPVISSEFLKNAVDAFISIEKAKSGELLLNKLSQMSPEDIDKLTELITTWDVNDIIAVLNEIDRRIVVIEAIKRIYEDKNTDELHTLHPLVLNARWLFGAEFDSPMFVSNSALSTVIKTLFKDCDYDLNEIENPKRRPDIICLNDFSLKAVCTDRIDTVSGLMKPDQILIIELKRGGFKIEADEVSQAEHYVRQIRKSAVIHSNATITAFVVGAMIGDVDHDRNLSSGNVYVVTYGQLVETANSKLFRLREQLKEHYNAIGTESLVEKALKESKQISINVI